MDQNYVTTVLPSTGAVGTGYPWSNPSRITADDGSNATFFPGGSATGSIVASGFDLNIPPEAVIDGIGIILDGTQGSASSTVKTSLVGGDTRTANFGGANGGATDLWGLNVVTLADIAGMSITVTTEAFGSGGSANLDYVGLVVYWHLDLSVDPVDVPTRIDYKMYSKDRVYLGLIPNVTSKLAFTQDKNSGGSSINIVSGKYITEEVEDVEAILDNTGAPLLTDANEEILAHTTTAPFAVGDSDDNAMFKNGNRVKVWIYNRWYPNGKLVFSGQVNKVGFSYGASTTVEMLVLSDGLDLSQNLVTPVSSYSYTPDVTQNVQDTYTTIMAYTEGAIIKGATSWRWLAQVFKAGAISRIGAIDLMMMGSADVTVTLTVAGSNQWLASVTRNVNNSSPTVERFTFNVPVDVIANNDYIITVQVPVMQSIRLYRSSTSVYDNGTAYLSDSGPFTPVGYDMYFVTQSASLGETTVSYSAQDPITGILADVFDDYNTRGGIIQPRNLVASGVSVPYDFNQDSVYDAVKKMIELAPAGYYAYVDLGLAVIDVMPASETADFTVVKGRDINIANFAFSIENVKNNLLFSGGEVGVDNLYRQYQDSESIGNYGVRTASKSDSKVIYDSTANAIGSSFIAENSDESQETSLVVFNSTVDITLLTPGKTIGFRNFGKPIDDMVLEIARREPNFSAGYVTLTLGRLPITLSAEIQRLNRELQLQQTINNPVAPS